MQLIQIEFDWWTKKISTRKQATKDWLVFMRQPNAAKRERKKELQVASDQIDPVSGSGCLGRASRKWKHKQLNRKLFLFASQIVFPLSLSWLVCHFHYLFGTFELILYLRRLTITSWPISRLSMRFANQSARRLPLSSGSLRWNLKMHESKTDWTKNEFEWALKSVWHKESVAFRMHLVHVHSERQELVASVTRHSFRCLSVSFPAVRALWQVTLHTRLVPFH